MPYIGNPIYQSAFVTDQFSGNGSTTAFTMSVAPAGVTNVLVAVSGVLQDPSTYGVTGTTITFSTAPPSGTGNISCRYLGIPVTGVVTTAYRTVTEFTATASQTTFTPPSYTVGYINVYRNGVLLGSADYTATNGTTVVLASGATAGDIVTVESFRVESVLNAISNSAGSVGTSNIADGAVTPAKLSTGGPSWDTSGNLTITGTGTVIESITSTSGTGKKWDLMSHTDGRFLIRQGTAVYAPMEIDPTTYTVGFNGTSPAINLSGGIQFPATQVASANANTLDDYEEGTWTPTAFGGVTAGTTTYTERYGYYTKIGNVVTAHCYISGTNSGGSGPFGISLPFISMTATKLYMMGNLVSSVNLAISGIPAVYSESGTNRAYFASVDTSGTFTNVAIAASFSFYVTLTYFA